MASYLTYLSDSTYCCVTQVFGNEGHLGTDIQFYPIYWSDLYFPKAGYVSTSAFGASGLDWTYGEHYEVQCDDGTVYRMAHMRLGSRAVSRGATVTAGQYAGQQGSTGNTTGETGIHLHLEYFVDGTRVSPAPLMGFPDELACHDIEFGGSPYIPKSIQSRLLLNYNRRIKERYNLR